MSYLVSPCLNDDGDNFGDIGQFGFGPQDYQAILIFEKNQNLLKSVTDAVVDTLKMHGYNASILDARDTSKTDGPMLKVLYPSVERLNCLRIPGFWSIQDYGTAVLGFSIKQPGDDRVLWSGSVINRSNVGSAMIATVGDWETVLNVALRGAIKEFGEQTRTAGFRNALVYDKSARLVDENKP